MKVRDLVSQWEEHAGVKMTEREYAVKLTLYDAARILALAEIYAPRTETQIITDLLGAALDELQEALPYSQGKRVIAADEYGDPIYEDVGPTPVFYHKTMEHLHRLETAGKEA